MIIEKNLIVNADDFGNKSSMNQAIVEAFRQGIINSTTIMANMSGFEEAVELAHNNKLHDKIGVHLVLTEGTPITEEVKRIDSLFNGDMTMSTRFKKLFFLNKNEKELIFQEYAAQIEKVRKSHIEITHVDTHHQIHDMWSITKIIMALLNTNKIPSMRILNNLEKSKYKYKNTYRSLINYYIRFKKVNFSDYLGNQVDFLRTFKTRSDFLNKRKAEIMVHPELSNEGEIIDKIGTKSSATYAKIG